VSILTQLKNIPTSHNGVAIDPEQIKAAVDYLTALHGPTVTKVRWYSVKGDKQIRAAFRDKSIASVGESVATLGVEAKNLPQYDGKETGPMKGAEWLMYPWIAVTTEGNLVARVYAVKETVKTTYIVDGEVADTADAKAMLYSRKPSENDTLILNIKIENLELVK
jgi:hypothetical protein